MPLEAQPELLETSITILKYLGLTGLGTFLATYSSWLAFPPELVIEDVSDKSKKFNSESRIKIRNAGRLPALNIKADATSICAQIGGISMNDCGIFNGPDAISRLSHGESSEISISPGIKLGNGMHISSFSYILTLRHKAKLLFLKKELAKSWKVELRNFEDGFSWHITII